MSRHRIRLHNLTPANISTGAMRGMGFAMLQLALETIKAYLKLISLLNYSMKHSFRIALALAALMVAGCTTTPTKVNTGPIHATTFNFVARGPQPEPGFLDNREPVHMLIQDSIARNLADKGLNKVASGGDVVVGYLVIIGNNAATEAINTYFGYGRNVTALHDQAQEAYDNNPTPHYFEAGTLLVDIIDAKSYKLLKRAYVTRPLLRNPAVEVRAANIQEAVDAVLKDVRISH